MVAVPSHMPVPPSENLGVSIEYLWRCSVEQYHAMIQAGILTEDDPVELLEGWVVTKMPKNPRHSAVTQLIQGTFARMLPADWHARGQEPITTITSEPEPDIVIARGNLREYFDRHPGPQDLALVVEVADSSLRRDRMLKKRLYAAASIPVYWVVNLTDACIESYSEPSGAAEQPDYRRQQVYSLAEEIPITLDGKEVARLSVRELLT